MVATRVDSGAGEMVVKMTVEAAGEMAVDWFDYVVGEMTGCWGEKMVMSRVGSRAGWTPVKMAGWL